MPIETGLKRQGIEITIRSLSAATWPPYAWFVIWLILVFIWHLERFPSAELNVKACGKDLPENVSARGPCD